MSQLRRQTQAAVARAILGVLVGVDPLRLGQQRRHLLRQNLLLVAHPGIAHRPTAPRGRPHLRAIQRDSTELDHPSGLAQLQRLHEQVPRRRRMPLAELRDRPIRRHLTTEDVPRTVGLRWRPR